MAKRPSSFQKFQPPAKLSARAVGDEKENKKPALSTVKISIAPDSDDEAPTVNPINNPNPRFALDNLRVSDQTYKMLTGFTSKIEAIARRRQSIIKTHETLASVINSGGVPGATRISAIPSPPPGSDFGLVFRERYKEKCKNYSIKLGCLLLGEYKNIVDELQSDIELIVTEGEDALALIADEIERRKAVELFHRLYQSALRKGSSERRRFSAKRRTHRR